MIRIGPLDPQPSRRNSPGPVVSSDIVCFGPSPANEAYEFESNSVYLLSPLSFWDGDLWLGRKHLHEGTCRPGMLRIAVPSQVEKKKYSTTARVLVIRIPEGHFIQMLCKLSPGDRSDRLEWNPILHADLKVRRLAGVLAKGQPRAEGPRTLLNEGIAEALLGLLIDHRRQSDRVEGRESRDGLTNEQQRASDLFLDLHIDQPPSVESWAWHLGLSRREFTRRFAQTNGVTPHAWLMEKRTRRAQALLIDSNISSGELALQLGFADQSHFTAAFTRRVGVSPVRWRVEERKRQAEAQRSPDR